MSRTISVRISDDQYSELIRRAKIEGYVHYSHLLIVEFFGSDGWPPEQIEVLKSSLKIVQQAQKSLARQNTMEHNSFVDKLIGALRILENASDWSDRIDRLTDWAFQNRWLIESDSE